MLLSHWFPRLRSVDVSRVILAKRRIRVLSSSRCVERLETRSLLTPAAVFVNSAWAAVTLGTDPDGPGPATDFGVDAFARIQLGLDAVQANGTVSVSPGSYVETLLIGKSVTLQGTSGKAADVVVSPLLASDNVISISAGATNVTLQHLTATGGAIGIQSLATGSVAAIDVSASAHSGNGLDIRNARSVTIEDGTWSGLKSRSVGNVLLHGSTMISTGNVDLEASNAITVGTSLDAGANKLRFWANLDGTGTQGFTQTAGTIRTTNDQTDALSIFVNTFGGGTGNAAIGSLMTGTTDSLNGGRVTIIALSGGVLDNNSDLGNIVSGSALLLGDGGVGAASEVLETRVHRLEGTGGAGGFVVVNEIALRIGELAVNTHGILTTTGVIDIDVRGPLTVVEDVVGPKVLLSSIEQLAAGDDLRIESGVIVRATQSNVELAAGDDLTVSANSLIESLAGGVFLKSDNGNFDSGTGSTILIDGTINSAIGARAEGDSDNDEITVSRLGVGGLLLSGLGRSDDYIIQYPPLPTMFGSKITIDDRDAGEDRVTINGTAAADELFFTSANPPTTVETEQVTRGSMTGEPIVIRDNIEQLTIELRDGSDTLHAQPSNLFEITVNGGNPCFGDATMTPGDTLAFEPLNRDFTIVGNAFHVNDKDLGIYPPLTFNDFETVALLPLGTGAPQLFDFNHTNTASTVQTSPTQPGFTSVRPDTLYSHGLGFGWQSPVASFERNDGFFVGPQAALIQDGHSFGQRAQFTVDVPSPGYYLVGALLGNAYADVTNVEIRNQDSSATLVSGISSKAGQATNVSFVAYVPDTSLDLAFLNSVVNPTIFGINGLSVRPAVIFTMGLAGCSHDLIADGVTVDDFTIVSAPRNAYVTVATNIGTIVTADVDPELTGIQVLTDNTGSAGLQIQRPFGGGIATVSLSEITGRATGIAGIGYELPPIRNFDFNHLNRESTTIPSPTMDPVADPASPMGFIGILPTDLYSPLRGFGWEYQPASFDDGERLTDLRTKLQRDGHSGTLSNAFTVDLPNDVYDVRLTLGYSREVLGLRVQANGVTIIENETTAAFEYLQKSFPVTVTNGKLVLELGNRVGRTWVINGLEIRSKTLVTPITFSPSIGDIPADGTTISSVVGHSQLPAGSIVTVASSLGLITDADLDENLKGQQIEVGSGGVVIVHLQAPNISGTPKLTITSLDGLHQGTIQSPSFLHYSVRDLRRFDFNHIASSDSINRSPTEPGFIGVTRFDLSPARDGFGWERSPSSNDVGAANADDQGTSLVYSVPRVDLNRDYALGHRRFGGRTILVEAALSTNYDIRVFTGNLSDDQTLRASVEGLGGSQSVTTLAGSFRTLTFFGAHDTNGDGFIDVSFGNDGGLSELWMANGIDVAASTISLPPTEALEAEIPLGLIAPAIPRQLATSALQRIVEVAIDAWSLNGATAAEVARLRNVTFTIADLGDSGSLGQAGSRAIVIDDDGAGFGWSAQLGSVAGNRFDLLTVVGHELGHILGRADEVRSPINVDDLMTDSLAPGVRHDRLGAIDDFFGAAVAAALLV